MFLHYEPIRHHSLSLPEQRQLFLPALNQISGVFVFDSSLSAFLSVVLVYRYTYFICHTHL